MSDRRLDSAIADHYGRAAMPAAARDHLLELAELAADPSEPTESTKPSEPVRGHATRPTRRWVSVALVSAAAGLLAGAGLLGGSDGDDDDEVAVDIALNHRKALAVEFVSTDYGDLGSSMGKLDFALAEPRLAMALVGGRYCSVKGELAAQLKIRDERGRTHTLYQTRWRDEFQRLDQRRVDLGDVVVTTWRRGDLLMGLASDD